MVPFSHLSDVTGLRRKTMFAHVCTITVRSAIMGHGVPRASRVLSARPVAVAGGVVDNWGAVASSFI